MDGETSTLELQFEGGFGLDEGWKAIDRLEGAVSGATVMLDFTKCHHVDTATVNLVAWAVARLGGRVQVRGLTRHDLRILEYLGVSLPGPAPPDGQD